MNSTNINCEHFCVEQIAAEQKKSLLFRPIDLLLSLLLLGSMAFSVFRGFVSETSQDLFCVLVLALLFALQS